MEYRNLGRSGLKVSTLTLGTMTFGGKDKFAMLGNSNAKEAKEIIDLCLDHGINMLDTANLYSFGVSEEIIGEVLKGKRPKDVLISSKARMRVGDGPNDAGFSRHHLIRECEKSLKRLQTDVIDVYYMHEWDGQTPLEEMLEALSTLVQQGKIRYIGCSNFSGWHIMKALGISNERKLPRFIAQQIHYTPEAREAEYELLPIAVDQGVGATIWTPLAGGLLSGKYTRNSKPEGETRVNLGRQEPPIRDQERLWDIVDVLNDIAKAHNVSAAQVTLAWTLSRPGVASILIGGRKIDQIKDNLGAASLELSTEDLHRINEVSQIPVLYPYWHQRDWAKDTFCEGDMAFFHDKMDY